MSKSPARLVLALAVLWGLATLGAGPAAAQEPEPAGAAAAGLQPWDPPETPVIIGAGGVSGLYFPVAGAIARIAEDHGGALLSPALVESTGGSMENLVRLSMGDLTFGIARSDRQHNAWHGLGEFAGMGPHDALRTVLALHSEPLTLIARADAGIEAFGDLPGHRINLGPEGTDTRLLLELVLHAEGWTIDEAFTQVLAIPFGEQMTALCGDRVDLVAFVAGHPSGTIHRALEACPTVLVPIAGPAIEALLTGNPVLIPTTIPGDFYPAVPEPVATIGPVAVLTTTRAVDEALVAALVDVILDNPDAFRGQHPALRDLTAAHMARDGLTAPFHTGARRAFEARGLRP
ncbi:MAG: TAXI family TRAP transporter solute-binding subunit [Alphaproteobacteria bacterium]|nr:TAXI family TRAP transporter solute-binding subunit [Alphaproteobacteria bacterium]